MKWLLAVVLALIVVGCDKTIHECRWVQGGGESAGVEVWPLSRGHSA